MVPMLTDYLTDKIGLEPILSVNVYLMVTVTETEIQTLRVNGPSRPVHRKRE